MRQRAGRAAVVAGVVVALLGVVPAASAVETVGLVDPVAGRWHLRAPDNSITSFGYGNPGDLPVAGDWDGNGTHTPGLYRQSDGFFYSRNSNSTGVADAECFAGDPEDVPISGDWDGDGDTTLGIYRPSQQRFYLFNATCMNAPMGAADVSFLFGNPGDKPVSGDWDGDGITEVGLHRESTGFFYWRNTLDSGPADGQIFFGDPNDRFVSGDWGVVDNVDTPAIFRPSDTTFYFRHSLSEGVADATLPWSSASAGWLPVAGEFGLGGPPPPPPAAWPPCDFAPFTVTGGKSSGGVAVVKDLVVPGDQPAIVELAGPPSAPGVNNFIVNALDANGNTIFNGGLSVNEGPSYTGTRAINHRAGFNPVRKIRVDANGDWTATVKPICSARKLTGTVISGISDDIIQVDRSGTATFSYVGSSNFIVYSYQGPAERDFLVNQLGNFTGPAAIVPGTDFVDINARGGGQWSLTLP